MNSFDLLSQNLAAQKKHFNKNPMTTTTMETFFLFFSLLCSAFFSFYSQFLSSCNRMFSSYTQCFFSNFFFSSSKRRKTKIFETPTKEKKLHCSCLSVHPSIVCLCKKANFCKANKLKICVCLSRHHKDKRKTRRKKKTTHIFRAFGYKNLRTTFANHTEIQRQKHIK